MAKSADIVVVGCINSDLVAFVSRLPVTGETVFSSAVEAHFGGKGANQAAQAALLLEDKRSTDRKLSHTCAFGQIAETDGIPVFTHMASNCGVAMIGRVGKDAAGASFLHHFASLGIDTAGVAIDSQNATGMALVTVAERGENTIAYVPAANAALQKDDLSVEPTLALLKNAKVVVSENGVPGPVSVECFRIAKKANPQSITIFTPAPVDFVDPEICCFTDFLLCNSVEAECLLKAWGTECMLDKGQATEYEIALACRLHDAILRAASKSVYGVCGASNVVITRGHQPCVIYANGKAALVPLAQQIPTELVIDTTGAGDSFAGAFAYFLLLTPSSPEVAVSRATFVAAQSVTKKGAAESYAGRHDLPGHLFQPQ